MARAIHKLSAVEAAKTRARGLHADGGGLYLRVGPTGAKSWIFRFMMVGQSHDMGLGAYKTIALAEARELAREARKKLLAGDNPIEVRARERRQKTEAKNLSFEECVQRYIDANKAGWKSEGSPRNFRQSFAKHVFPVVGSRAQNTPNPVTAREIDREIVLKVVTPIWYEHPKWRAIYVGGWKRCWPGQRSMGTEREKTPPAGKKISSTICRAPKGYAGLCRIPRFGRMPTLVRFLHCWGKNWTIEAGHVLRNSPYWSR